MHGGGGGDGSQKSPNLHSSSSLFKDISNFKTPKHPSAASRTFQNINTPQFFAASKQTPLPSSTVRRRPSMSAAKSKAVRRLKAFELEQSQSARKEQIKKEKSMKSLANSLTVWLNFLFENPRLCGCGGELRSENVIGGGKRETLEGRGGIRVDGGFLRVPKRLKEGSFGEGDDGNVLEISSSKLLNLRESLNDVCSFDDLKERIRGYLSLSCCKEVFYVMSQVTKNIDEGRLKMKAHCPIVTDVGMKERAIKLLNCYNPVWLRIGLYIIFGGESLLPIEDSDTEHDIAFLKVFLEKHFFSHAGLAKSYAYNKMVEGLYRPGYFETLGNVILKRLFLLVLILDRVKSQSSLDIKYGIDGLDSGSPLLFTIESQVKSSRQMINDFLTSDVMLGEGNLLAHLVILGYKVSYQQSPLIEYNFRVTDLFEDIQDGVRLCRAIQLLQHDASILMKMVLPSDTNKKKLVNCGIALQYLKKAGVRLHDDDGMVIEREDIASGDKELTLSLLWNMFVHLQLPLLITKLVLFEEISKIRKVQECMDIDTSNHLDMLLNWVKAICENYDSMMERPNTLLDGKAIWCLLDFYFRKELQCSSSTKDKSEISQLHGDCSIVSIGDTADAVHNFVLSQKLAMILGSFPEVLQISDVLEYKGACNDKSVIILLVFLSSELLVKKSKDQLNFHKLMGCHCQTVERKHCSSERWLVITEARLSEDRDEHTVEDASKKFKAVQAWWQEMARRNYNCVIKPAATNIQHLWSNKCSSDIWKANAAIVIQSHFRKIITRRRFMKLKNATSFLQLYIRAWLLVKQIKLQGTKVEDSSSGTGGTESSSQLENIQLIRKQKEHNLRNEAARKILLAWKQFRARKKWLAAAKIQTQFRSWFIRSSFVQRKAAAIRIQSIFRSLRSQKVLEEFREATKAAVVIQSHVHGSIAREGARQLRIYIVTIQRHCRRWLTRKNFLSQWKAAIFIQGAFRTFLCQREFHTYRSAAIEIQCYVRGRITCTKLLGASRAQRAISRDCVSLTSGGKFGSAELKIVLEAVLKLQMWWRRVLLLKSRCKAAIVIQSHVRGWACRRKLANEKHHHIVLIQSHWKGYLSRRDAKGKLVDLREKIQKSAANVDEGMRIINRLIAALKELKSMKNVSGILHNCATLDMATRHSQICCERLVEEGAIDILLGQIRSVTRSIPDQEVLKHCLSTLRNLAQYPNLADALINHRGSVETLLRELLRNKEDGYFIACELMKELCVRRKGVEAVHSLPSMLKRLHMLAEDLARKATHDKRKNRSLVARDMTMTERRLREASELLNLITRHYGKSSSVL